MAELVLISGGSGMIGQALANHLSTNGYEVNFLSRSIYQKDDPRARYWNVKKSEIEPEAIRKADHIIHLAGANMGTKKWSKERKREILDSRVKSTGLLLKVLSETKHPLQTFVSASAVGYYGWNTGSIVMDENRKKPGDDFVSVVVREWESTASKIETLGIRTVILRFGLVLNSSEGVLKRLMMPVKLGLGSGIGSGEQYMSWIHISDLCELILFSLKKPSVRGIYNAVSPSPVTNKDMMHSIATHMGKPFFMPNVPAFLLRLLYGEMSSMILGGSRVSCAKIESAGFTFKYNTIDQALNDLIKK